MDELPNSLEIGALLPIKDTSRKKKNSPRKKHIVNAKKPADEQYSPPKSIELGSNEPKNELSGDNSPSMPVGLPSYFCAAHAKVEDEGRKVSSVIAMESIAALKMHNFTKNRKSLSYKNSKLAIEMGGYQEAKLAELGVQLRDRLVPAIAAWKIKYYIERYRHNRAKVVHTDRELYLGIQLQGAYAEYEQSKEVAKLQLQQEKEYSKDALEAISNNNIELEQTKSVIQVMMKNSTEEHIKNNLKLKERKSSVSKMTEKLIFQHQVDFERLRASLDLALSKQLVEVKVAQDAFEEEERKYLKEFVPFEREFLHQIHIDPVVRTTFPSSVTSVGNSIAQQLAAATVLVENTRRAAELALTDNMLQLNEKNILVEKKMALMAKVNRAESTLALNMKLVEDHRLKAEVAQVSNKRAADIFVKKLLSSAIISVESMHTPTVPQSSENDEHDISTIVLESKRKELEKKEVIRKLRIFAKIKKYLW